MQVSAIIGSSVYPMWAIQAAERNVAIMSKKDEEENGGKVSQEVVNAQIQNVANFNQPIAGAKVSESASSKTWAPLMHKLGLKPTGDYSKDYNTTISRLNELIKYTKSPDKLKEYLSLADQVNRVFVTPQTSGIANNSLSGSEQIAQLNKAMMLNIKMSL